MNSIEIASVEPKLLLADLKCHERFNESKKDYLKQLSKLQNKMRCVQQAYYRQGKKAVVVFEGWDAAGKGGCIRRITEKLDPRGYKVFPIAAPNDEELSKHYLYRFFQKLPSKGTITILDRSYYGRVLVERVEGFAMPKEWHRAFQEINDFERLLTDDDTKVIKVFLHISQEEQLRRFKERLNNPLKQWKLTEEDLRNRDKWHVYESAVQDMFDHTHTRNAPWHLVGGDHKWYTRLATLKLIIEKLSEDVDITNPNIDEALVKLAQSKLGITSEASKN